MPRARKRTRCYRRRFSTERCSLLGTPSRYARRPRLHRCALRPSPVPLIRQDAKQRRLAAARWSDETHELTGGDRNAQIVDRDDGVLARLKRLTKVNRSRSPRRGARLPASGLMVVVREPERSDARARLRDHAGGANSDSATGALDEFFFHVEVLDVHDARHWNAAVDIHDDSR